MLKLENKMKNDDDVCNNDTNLNEEETLKNQLNQQNITGAYIIDASNLTTMYNSLVASFGDQNGSQLFTNMTGIHVLNGNLIPSMALEYDIIN